MNVSIPDSLREFVLSRVIAGGHASVDDYVGGLVEADRERAAKERLENELEHGLASKRVPDAEHREQFKAILAQINRKYGKTLKKLAE